MPSDRYRFARFELAPTVSHRPRVDGYWCETVVRSPDAGGEWHLGGHWADTPWAALEWLRCQALRIADALDPSPGGGPLAAHGLVVMGATDWNPGRTFREWAEDADHHRVQLDALHRGRPVSANSRGPDRVCGFGEVDVFYSLSARPIRRDAPARRLLRAC
ncbi:hypothetical protein [Streptomyces otsuchiensis]|uniref:hypothetical protein n=1 Tax=Streptomyces otsuchiensis TaxID=2681388 RepID=UPI001031AB5A|nr:hypothetical protein [Streptomyces otsuchiensis]